MRLNERLRGSTVEVLVEGTSLRNARKWTGRTRGNKIVVFSPMDGLEVGQLRNVLVDRAMPQTLYGNIEA